MLLRLLCDFVPARKATRNLSSALAHTVFKHTMFNLKQANEFDLNALAHNITLFYNVLLHKFHVQSYKHLNYMLLDFFTPLIICILEKIIISRYTSM